MSGEVSAVATDNAAIRDDDSFYGSAKSESGFRTYRYESRNYARPVYVYCVGLQLEPRKDKPTRVHKQDLLTILPLNNYTAELWCYREEWDRARDELNKRFNSR